MNDFLINMAMSTIITLLQSIKGPQKKAQFKKVFLKVFTLMRGVYGDDPDFQWK